MLAGLPQSRRSGANSAGVWVGDGQHNTRNPSGALSGLGKAQGDVINGDRGFERRSSPAFAKLVFWGYFGSILWSRSTSRAGYVQHVES